jgi:hypothetical protein
VKREVCAHGLAVLLSATCLAAVASAQTNWWKNFGGLLYSCGTSVQQTSDSGYIITGYTYAFGAGSADVWLIKTDAQGDTAWARTYGGADYERGNSVQQTSDGGYIIAGYVWEFTDESYDVLLIKTDARGDTTWTRKCTPGEGYSVQQTADGGYIIAGQAYGLLLIKTDPEGDTLWTKTYGSYANACANSVQQTADGGYIAAGVSVDDAYLVRTDSLGDTIWTRTYPLLGWDPCYSVQQTSDGGYILTGQTEPHEEGLCRAYLIKTDAQGDTLWTRVYGDSCHHGGRSVRQTSDGGYIVAGWAYTANWLDQIDVYLVKTDIQGDTLWTKSFGGRFSEEGNSVGQAADGGYIVTGYTFSFGIGYGDVYLIKTDSLGNATAVAENGPMPQATGHKLAATVIRNLPESTMTYDAISRRVLHPKPGIYFVREPQAGTQAQAVRKVVLTR